MAIYHPPTFINQYLIANLEEFQNRDTDPFFPTSPTAIHDLTETFPQSSIFAVYDRMLKMRRSPFPHIKSEQLLYYFYSQGDNSIENIINTTQKVQDLLDREDESAQELNSWIAAKQASENPLRDSSGNVLPSVFFHRIRIYQLEETRDIIDFGTARTYAGNKIIIDYDWHKS